MSGHGLRQQQGGGGAGAGPRNRAGPKLPKATGGRSHGAGTEPVELAMWRGQSGSALAAATAPALSGGGEGVGWEQEAADLEDIGRQVLSECASIADGESVAAEGIADFVGALTAGAEGAFKVLDSFGPVGPLFKSLGMFAHHVMEVRDSRVEGRRLLPEAQVSVVHILPYTQVSFATVFKHEPVSMSGPRAPRVVLPDTALWLPTFCHSL